MISRDLMILTLAVSALAAASAHAETSIAAAPLMAKVDTAEIKPKLDLTSRRIFIGATPAQSGEAIPAGTVRTAVDHQFGSQNVAALGYLCGLQPGPNETSGPASAYDTVGTFLGAQLRVAFR